MSIRGKRERRSERKLTAGEQDPWHSGSDATAVMAHL